MKITEFIAIIDIVETTEKFFTFEDLYTDEDATHFVERSVFYFNVCNRSFAQTFDEIQLILI